MRKGEELEVEILGVKFPNKPFGIYEDVTVYPNRSCIPGQIIKGNIKKMRKGKVEIGDIEVIKKAENEIDGKCIHFKNCGGCTYQNLSYSDQLALKRDQISKLLINRLGENVNFLGIIPSKKQFEYRNKMELTFGNEEINGPLTLGLHKRGSFYDIITIDSCLLMDQDFRKIVEFSIEFFKEEGLNFYHKRTHIGFLRHLVIRKGEFTNELLINLVTSTQIDYDLTNWMNGILKLGLSNKIIGLLWTKNNNISDAVNSEEEIVLYGKRDFSEKLLDLDFEISPYSFFQTNSEGAEILYSTILDYISSTENKIIFDLFSGTGTIGQIVSKKAEYVYGIELIKEAVAKANENTKLNNIKNCEFIAGDVFKKIDELKERRIKPDIIILDPPRPGVGAKALEKILDYEVDEVIYVSCNPKTFIQDLEIFLAKGFEYEKGVCVDMFPNTPHVELISRLVRK